jgi:Uma2 family endonuclease
LYDLIAEAILTQKIFRIDQIHKKLKYYKRYRLIKHEQVYSVAPEICVEVVSAGQEELLTKIKLYFKAGAREVWYCDEDGSISFYTGEGESPYSKLMPEFPDYIEV